MSKNTLFALVLSLGILILWSYYSQKRSGQGKIDKNPPVFNDLRKVTPDYKNGYIKGYKNGRQTRRLLYSGIGWLIELIAFYSVLYSR